MAEQGGGDPARRRARIRLVQKYLLNPPTKLLASLGLLPGHVLLETIGRRTGRRRRTVVGVHRERRTLWIVAEQGRHAGYVRNLVDQPRVRVRTAAGWQPGTAAVVDDDDPQARLSAFDSKQHARAVRFFGTELLSIRVDLDQRGEP